MIIISPHSICNCELLSRIDARLGRRASLPQSSALQSSDDDFTKEAKMAAPLFFSTFEVTRQAFHRTALAYAIVNLKPIVPGRTCAVPAVQP